MSLPQTHETPRGGGVSQSTEAGGFTAQASAAAARTQPLDLEDFDNLPDEMRHAKRWLVWRLERGDTKPLKVPYWVNGRKRAGTQNGPEDLANLATFAEAVAAFETGRFDGLGFACGPDGTGNYWQAIDLDNLPERPHLREIADEMPGFTDDSPSGTGRHAYGYGRRFDMLKSNASGIEAFCPTQFVTVTCANAGAGKVECLADYVENVLAPMHSPTPSQEPAGHSPARHIAGVVVEAGRHDDVLRLTSHQAALVVADGMDPAAAMDALRRERDRGRWTREMDDPELRRGLEGAIAKYRSGEWELPAFAKRGPVEGTPPVELRLVPMDGVMDERAEDWPHVIQAYFPRRVTTLVGGHGGVGKSMLALIFAAHVAAGRPWGPLEVEHGRAVFLSFEDEAKILRQRLRRIIEVYQLPPADVFESLVIFDGSDAETELAIESADGRALEFTPMMGLVADAMRGADFVIVDNASDTYGANENQRRLVRGFIRRLSQEARANDASVAVLAHIDKAAAKFGGKGNNFSGSTQWHNSVRSRLALVESEETGIQLLHEKANYGPLHEPLTLLRGAGGVLEQVPAEQAAAAKATAQAVMVRADAKDVLAVLRAAVDADLTIPVARTGQRTTWHALCEMPEMPEPLRAKREGKPRVEAAITALEREGAIVREEYRNPSRRMAVRWTLAQEQSEKAA